MRSTRATAAIARLNTRSEGHDYSMAITGTGLFILRERSDGTSKALCDALPLDDFVRLVDSMGPKKIPRITKSEAAFLKQLVKDNPSQ
jgi:hypothetical protein